MILALAKRFVLGEHDASMLTADEINRSLKVYLGSENGGYQPAGDHDARLLIAFPKDYELRRVMIDKYLAEDFGLQFSSPSLSEAAHLFAERLRAKYPELDSISCAGLANRFAYSWK